MSLRDSHSAKERRCCQFPTAWSKRSGRKKLKKRKRQSPLLLRFLRPSPPEDSRHSWGVSPGPSRGMSTSESCHTPIGWTASLFTTRTSPTRWRLPLNPVWTQPEWSTDSTGRQIGETRQQPDSNGWARFWILGRNTCNSLWGLHVIMTRHLRVRERTHSRVLAGSNVPRGSSCNDFWRFVSGCVCWRWLRWRGLRDS